MRIVETGKLMVRWWRAWHALPVWSWVRAAGAYRAGQFAVAERFYRRGLRTHASHPASSCARLDLSYCLFKLGRLEEAEQNLRLVTNQSPTSREGFLRLARLQLWSGQTLEAAWTIRRALRNIPADADLAATYLLAVLDSDGPAYLLTEASETANRIDREGQTHPRLKAPLARLRMMQGKYDAGRAELVAIANTDGAPFEALVLLADVQLHEGKLVDARKELRRALKVAPDYPRVLSMLAETYLTAGPFYNAQYAQQLALSASQLTNWASPREMHLLAESYYHIGDKMSALIIASKAKHVGLRLLGSYRDTKSLEQLIESLESSTLA